MAYTRKGAFCCDNCKKVFEDISIDEMLCRSVLCDRCIDATTITDEEALNFLILEVDRMRKRLGNLEGFK